STARGSAGFAGLLGGTLVLGRRERLWVALSGGGSVKLYVDGRALGAYGPVHGDAEAWNAFPVDLDAGEHDLVIAYSRGLTGDRVRLRVLDRERLRVPEASVWRLRGVGDGEAPRLTRALTSTRLETELGADGHEFRLDVEYPGGLPLVAPQVLEVSVSLEGRMLYREALGATSVDRFGAHAFSARLPGLPRASLPRDPSPARFDVRTGTEHLSFVRVVGEAVMELTLAAAELGAALALDARAPRDASVTLERGVLDLLRATHSRIETRRELASLGELVAELAARRNPLYRPGWVHWARPSASDGSPERLVIAVPPGFDVGAPRRYPLVVLLHGYRGTPESVMAAFTGRRGRALEDALVVAPHAHGDAFYRGPGERAVMDAVRWMLQVYPIDPRRVTVTGVSMGGTGAAAIALRYPDTFAGAAPLAGYHSYFLRRDVAGRPLSDWERAGVHHLSTSSFAEQARLVPFFVAHGKRDQPLSNSRSLVERLMTLGYALNAEWPDTGHDVWTLTYGSPRFKRWLSARVRPEAPRELVIQADTLRYGRQEWLEITELARSGQRGKLTAKFVADDRVEILSSGVSGLCVRPETALAPPAATLVIDGYPLEFIAGKSLGARFRDGRWGKAACEPEQGSKRPGVEGPIRDAFLEPLVFVYGAGDPATHRANREVARHFANFGTADVAYPVISDRALPPEVASNASLWLVGTPSDHGILGAIARRLPFSLRDGELFAHGRRLGSGGAGALFVQPNPLSPEHYVVVTLGTDAAGIWRALSLPRILPDFAVYDDALAPAAGQPVLGAGTLLASGFFDRRWRLPENIMGARAP
ncbi:MAG TPA: alpha/beta hydrolase-fold protein, partial [Polyangiaceae bacterium]